MRTGLSILNMHEKTCSTCQMASPPARTAGIVLMLLLAGHSLLAAPPRRFGSGPLMRSVQNETDAAIARAQRWLIEQQAADGSWGGRNPYLTAVCALAVSGDGDVAPQANVRAVASAVLWLTANPVTNAATAHALQATAWRELALLILALPVPDAHVPPVVSALPIPTNLLAELSVLEVWQARGERPAPHTDVRRDANPAEALIRAAQWQAPRQTVRERIADVARDWTTPEVLLWREGDAQCAWWLARTINRQAQGGLFLSPALAIDWRRDLAGYWVNHQRITPRGGGHWDSEAAASVEETAFAILLLREL